MNESSPFTDERLDALLAGARAARPDTSRREYGFETRLLARLRARRESEPHWSALSWRMLPFFAVLVLLLTLWHAEVIADSGETQGMNYIANVDSGDLTGNLN
jgi:hypothetical protein